MRSADLVNRLDDRPFKPFRIHLSDGMKLPVTNPGLVMVGRSSAVLATDLTTDEEGHEIAEGWRTIALTHIVQFTDLDEPSGGKSRRRSRR